MRHSDIRVGLDVGTSKVCVVVADADRDGVKVIGSATSPSEGMRRGTITDMDAVVASIRGAVQEASTISGVRIKSVSVNISGGHIQGFASTGAIGVRRGVVKQADVDRAIEAARTVYVPLDREVVHVLPTEFILDGHDGITNPVGMAGVRLEARVNVITCAISPLQNILTCCGRTGLDVVEVVFGPLAAGRSVLTAEEKDFGAILVDVGAGSTEIAIFRDNSIRFTSVLGIGGSHITNDIAVGLRTTPAEAERIKRESGMACIPPAGLSGEITVPYGGETRNIERSSLIGIMQPRCEEILEMIRNEIRRAEGYETAHSGVVLTGGAALLNGFDRLAGTELGLPVRLGFPRGLRGLKGPVENPAYATAAGLALGECEQDKPQPRRQGGGVFEKARDWMKDLSLHTHFTFTRKEGGTACLKSKR